MKNFVTFFTAFCLLATPFANAKEEIAQLATQTDELYRAGCGAEDGAYTALSSSMVAWGVGAAVVIALLVGALSSSTSHSHADEKQ